MGEEAPLAPLCAVAELASSLTCERNFMNQLRRRLVQWLSVVFAVGFLAWLILTSPADKAAKLLLDWTAAIAWPLVIVLLIVTYRKEFGSLLSNISSIAERAHKEPVEIALGEKLKLVFREGLNKVEQQARTVLQGTPGVDMPPVGGGDTPPAGSRPPATPLPPNYRVNLDRLAETLPRAAMLEAWSEVELALEQVTTFEGLGGALHQDAWHQLDHAFIVRRRFWPGYYMKNASLMRQRCPCSKN